MSFNDSGKKAGASTILLALLLALISLVLLVVFVGFSLWFWIALALWVLFTLIFYFRLFSFFVITSVSLWLVFAIFMILTIVFMFVGDNGSTSGTKSSGSTLVSCTSNGTDTPVSVDGWKANIFSKTIDSNNNTDSGIRSFSINSLNAKTGTGLYFLLEKNDGSNVTGVKGLIEVCDSNNMTKKYETTKDTTTTPASEGATAVYYYLHGNKRVSTPGTYRIDAWANVDGSWKLVDREVGVQFTE